MQLGRKQCALCESCYSNGRVKREGGRVDSYLEQWGEFAGGLFGNEFSSIMEGLHEEVLVRG